MAGTSVAVVCFSAAVGTSVHPASADPIGSTRAQISATQSQIEAGAAQIHNLTLAFQEANLTASTLGQQARADQATIARLQARVSGSDQILRREVLLSYTGGTTDTLDSPGRAGPAGPTSDPSVRLEYLQMATGDLNDAVDQFRTQQRQLASAQAALEHQQQLSEAAAASAC
jgi:hypothetical protein